MIPAAYRSLLHTPFVARALVTSLLARLVYPTAGLAIVLLVVGRTGSYAAGGSSTAVLVAGAGIGGLGGSRLIDRGWARPVLYCTAVVSAAALVVLAAVPTRSLPVLLAIIAVVGFTLPPVTPAVRSLWPVLLTTEDERAAMYSLEATVQELTWVVGPALAGGCAAASSARVAVVLAAAILLGGTAAFAWTPGLARLVAPSRAKVRRAEIVALAGPMAVGALIIGALNSTEVSIIGTAGLAGARPAAGVLIAIWSAGSMCGGLVLGARPPRHGVRARLVVLLAASTAGTAALAAIPGLVLLGVALFAVGALVAPALGALYGQVETLAPPAAVAQTFAVLGTVALGGGAVGSAVGGSLVQSVGPPSTFLFSASLAAAAALLAAATGRRSQLGLLGRQQAVLAQPPVTQLGTVERGGEQAADNDERHREYPDLQRRRQQPQRQAGDEALQQDPQQLAPPPVRIGQIVPDPLGEPVG